MRALAMNLSNQNLLVIIVVGQALVVGAHTRALETMVMPAAVTS